MLTTPLTDPSTIPASFTEFDRFLVEKTDAALIDGIQLERWSRDPNRKVNEFRLDLDRRYNLVNRAYGYFSDVEISGRTLTAVGCRQEVTFGKLTGPNPEERLREYVLGVFMPSSHWMYADGWPGGFTFKQMIYCTTDGELGRYSDAELESPQDWRLIGTKYRWSLLTIFLHDFVVKVGPFTKHLDEAVAVVQHPDFIHIVEKPKKGIKLEVAFGYPFIDFAPIPNYFGFGPGKFNWAIKTFSFLLRDNNEVLCNMDFVAGARPKKVFDFGEHVTCPIYGTADFLRTLTLGYFDAPAVHDWMDGNMMNQHGRVHQALMEGAAKVFADWAKEH